MTFVGPTEGWFMRVEIFDVGHGHCAVITAPNGGRIMLDCGDRWAEDRFWTPSLHYFGLDDQSARSPQSRRGPPQRLPTDDRRLQGELAAHQSHRRRTRVPALEIPRHLLRLQ